MTARILANPLGLEFHEPTEPVRMSHEFAQRFFDIELNFDKKDETFTVSEDGKQYQLNHLTETDLYLATTLNVIRSSTGLIQDVTKHAIYRAMCNLYEEPITNPQFYASLRKLVLHGLITEIPGGAPGVYSYRVNYVYQETEEGDKPKVGRYFDLDPVVFTKRFSSMSLAYKKLYYSVAAQQSGNKPVFRLLRSNKGEHVEFMGLYRLLHKNQPNHIRTILTDMAQASLIDGEPLFSYAELKRNKQGGYIAHMQINPVYIPKNVPNQKLFKPLQPKMVHPRAAAFIRSVLATLGLGELVKPTEVDQLVRYFKGKGHRVIRVALNKIRDFYQRNKTLPNNIIGYLVKSIQSTASLVLTDIATKTGMRDFIMGGASPAERGQRESDFVSTMSRYKPRSVEKACRAAYPMLQQIFSRKLNSTVDDYRGFRSLDTLTCIHAARHEAFRLKKSRRAYGELEMRLQEMLRVGVTINPDWLFDQVNQLPEIQPVILVPDDFKLAEYLLANFKAILIPTGQ